MIWEDFIEIGYIAKAHGIKGEVKAVFDVHDIKEYLGRKTLWLAKAPGKPEPFEVRKINPAGKHSIVTFKDMYSRDDAEALAGHTLLIPEKELPPLEEGQFYFYEILGFSIHDVNQGALGTVKDIWEGGKQEIIVMAFQGKEVLIPAAEEVLLGIDREKQQVLTHLPEGLLEMYVESG